MAHDEAITTKPLQLPSQVVSPADVARLARELEAIEDFLHQTTIRKPGSKSPALPRASQLLDELVALNHLNLLEPGDRQQIADFLGELKASGLLIHISFARDPSAAFMDKIVTWFRANVHPLLLLRVGLEPTIAAGCIVRTPNRIFDFSLHQHFIKQRQTLIKLINDPNGDPGRER